MIRFPNPARFARAIRDRIRDWWNYEPLLATMKVAEGRRSQCFGCPRYNHLTGQCEECSCFVLIKSLAAGESCPLGKWEAYEVKTPSRVRNFLKGIAAAMQKLLDR